MRNNVVILSSYLDTSITPLLTKFGSLKELKTLWLDDNQLSDFPISLCQLDSLRTLRLSGNDLSYIPSSISSLQLLEVLVSTFSRHIDYWLLMSNWRRQYSTIFAFHPKLHNHYHYNPHSLGDYSSHRLLIITRLCLSQWDFCNSRI